MVGLAQSPNAAAVGGKQASRRWPSSRKAALEVLIIQQRLDLEIDANGRQARLKQKAARDG